MIRSESGVLRCGPRQRTVVNTDAWITKKEVQLHNGLFMPNPVFGTRDMFGVEVEAAVHGALRGGYKHIDASTTYNNLEAVGRGLAHATKREDVWLTLKVHGHGGDHLHRLTRKALKQMATPYIDLLVLEWPGTVVAGSGIDMDAMRRESWMALQSLHGEGACRAIGVSNFEVKHLKALLPACDVVPHVNQFEYHPKHRDEDLVRYCRANKIVCVGYMVYGGGRLLEDDTVRRLAHEVERAPTQVLGRWCLQHGVVPCTASRIVEHAAENWDIFRFVLRDRYFRALDALNTRFKYDWDPRFVD